MLNVQFGDSVRFMDLTRHAEERGLLKGRIAQGKKALDEKITENAGLTAQLATEREKSHSLEAQLTQAKSELVKAIQRHDLESAKRGR